MADISKITIESGTYNIKDEQARNDLVNLNNYYQLQTNKKIIFIGDSYLEGWTPDGNTTSFGSLVAGKLNANYIEKYLGGVGFSATINNRNFITLLDEITADDTITDIIVAGGYNDRVAKSGIWSGINNFKTLANTKFPNAKIHIGAVGWTTDTEEMYSLTEVVEAYNYTCKELNIHYMSNLEFTLHVYGQVFASDGIHPNQYGQYRIADNIAQCLLKGSCDVIGNYKNITVGSLGSNITSQDLSYSLGATLNNNIVEVSTQGYAQIFLTDPIHLNGSSGIEFKLYDINITSDYSYIIGNMYNFNTCYVPAIIHSNDGTYDNAMIQIIFKNGGVYIKIPSRINRTNSGFADLYITQIQIMSSLHATFNTLWC